MHHVLALSLVHDWSGKRYDLGVAFGPGFPLQVLIALRCIPGFTLQSLTQTLGSICKLRLLYKCKSTTVYPSTNSIGTCQLRGATATCQPHAGKYKRVRLPRYRSLWHQYEGCLYNQLYWCFQCLVLPWLSHSMAVSIRFCRVASVLASVIHSTYSFLCELLNALNWVSACGCSFNSVAK